jgi:hypothetical protein
MHGALKRHARIGRRCGEDGCEETFHVGSPASVKPVVFLSQPERIGGPFRFSGGYHIHVPGQNVTGPIGRSEGGEEIGTVSLRPRNHGYSCAMAFQIFGNPSGNVAIGRSHHGRKGDETLKDFDCVHGRPRWPLLWPHCSLQKLRTAEGVYLLKSEVFR